LPALQSWARIRSFLAPEPFACLSPCPALRDLVVLAATANTSLATDSFPAQVSVFFSPYGGYTEAIVRALGTAIAAGKCDGASLVTSLIAERCCLGKTYPD